MSGFVYDKNQCNLVTLFYIVLVPNAFVFSSDYSYIHLIILHIFLYFIFLYQEFPWHPKPVNELTGNAAIQLNESACLVLFTGNQFISSPFLITFCLVFICQAVILSVCLKLFTYSYLTFSPKLPVNQFSTQHHWERGF